MAYYLDLFSPETYEAFGRSDRTISGFRLRQRNVAQRVKSGDKFVCYMTTLSRWIGLLQVLEGPFIDHTPIFYPEDDPFVVRFRVRELVWLPVEKAVPIHEAQVWDRLSFTRGQSKTSSTWTGKLRGSLVQLDDSDGIFLETLLRAQVKREVTYPVDPDTYRKLTTHRVRRADKDVTVTVPEEVESEREEEEGRPELRESTKIQALLVEIGARMGMQIWVPRSDRASVLAQWQGDHPPLLERLPLNYDETTLKTIEQIDVLWLKGRAIKRAFEVEHSTSVYSGILRMADLLALQPNMDIRLHIVAPLSRREKVFQELRRPVFSLLDRGPLSESCTYLSYDSVRELAGQPHLSHLSDSVLEEYEEEAED
jgi:predicted RNA-binding protein